MTSTTQCSSLSAPPADYRLIALTQSEVAFGLTDLNGIITWTNGAFARLTGYGCEELAGCPVGMLRARSHSEAFYAGIRETLDAGTSWAGRLNIGRKDGTECAGRGIAAPVWDADGSVVGYSIIARDTTEETRLEAQIAQLQKMEAIGELAAGIAHEINTPIQYVGDNLQFLQGAVADVIRLVQTLEAACESGKEAAIPPEAQADIRRIRDEIDLDFLREELPQAIEQALEGRDRVAAIVRAMKEFAHPGDDSLTPVDINHAIENTLAVSRGEWKHLAEIERNLDPAMPSVPCYPGSFNQVLLNLVVNAAHAIAEKRNAGNAENGTITVATRVCGNTAEVVIGDTGNGIPAEIVHRIFEPFYTTKDVGKGTGQGLALAHAVIVEKMKGRIEVDSAPGEGARFTLYLPLSPPESGETVGA